MDLLFVSMENDEGISSCPSNWDSDAVASSASTDSDLSCSPMGVAWSKRG